MGGGVDPAGTVPAAGRSGRRTQSSRGRAGRVCSSSRTRSSSVAARLSKALILSSTMGAIPSC